MKSFAAAFFSLAAFFAASSASAAPEGRFDAQVFRPLAAPRDLVMVPKSEVIGHLSPVVGLYWDAALDPLALVVGDTGKTLNAVGARLQITPLLGIGLFDWAELTMAIPFVAWQTSDNLRSIGTEGKVKSTPGLGDIRLSTKIALPWFNRKDEVKSGFGMAIGGNLNLPTGDPLAFTSDGSLSGGADLIADYRFNFGLLLSSNLGVWIRPEHQFAGVKIGDMAQFGLAGEMYIVQRWGVSVIGEVYGYPSLTSFPDSPEQVPAEVLLGIRWQTRQGITITIGGSFGAACGFGAPAIRIFNSITWQPKNSVEQQEINRLQERDSVDPDHDGVIAEADKCPDKPGRPENGGCPDKDSDEDGWMDREDDCPDLPAGKGGQKGCPIARIKGDEIFILDQVHFATDKDIILDESKPILDAVASVLRAQPDIREIEIEGHTDVRASDAYNMDLSQRRVNSVMAGLVDRHIDPARMKAVGYGHSRPTEDDTGCLGPDDKLTPECKTKTSKNRRVVFRIKRYGAAPSTAIGNPADNSSTVLPQTQPTLPTGGSLLPTGGSTLPTQGVLQKDTTLPNQQGVLKQDPMLKKSEPTLPSNSPNKGTVLPNGASNLPNK